MKKKRWPKGHFAMKWFIVLCAHLRYRSVIVQCLSYHNSLKASLKCDRVSRFFLSLTKADNILSVVVVAIQVKLQIGSWPLFCTFMLKQCFFTYSIRVTWGYAGESLWNASTNVAPKIFLVRRWDTKVFYLSLGLETRLLNSHSSSSFLHLGALTRVSWWGEQNLRSRLLENHQKELN